MTEDRRSCLRREKDEICKLHPQMEKKIDTILENQGSYMGHQVILASDVAEIKAIVNNGLKDKMVQTTMVISELKDKMEALDDFQWFREFVNDLRNKMFKTICKYALIGGILAFIASFFFSGGIKLWQIMLN